MIQFEWKCCDTLITLLESAFNIISIQNVVNENGFSKIVFKKIIYQIFKKKLEMIFQNFKNNS